MTETNEVATIEQHTEKPANVVEQYKAYIAERTNRREEIKKQLSALADELKAINEELDGEKKDVIEIRSLLTQTRKRRETTKPVEIDAATGEPKPRKGPGRPKGSGKKATNDAQ